VVISCVGCVGVESRDPMLCGVWSGGVPLSSRQLCVFP
jgi:hypothetical protein